MQYQVKKSSWAALTPLCLLFFWLVIPLIIMIFRMIKNANETIEFYDNKVVHKSGILSKREKSNVFAGVLAVSVEQSFLGRIFGYGNVRVDIQGRWDIDTSGVKDPHALKEYLESRVVPATGINPGINPGLNFIARS